MQAKRALKLIEQYVAEKILEVRGDQISQNAPKTTGAADHEIFRVVAMHIRTQPVIVLTVDGKLTEQLQTLVTHENYETKDLCIARVNPDGQLRPNHTQAQHEEWLSHRQQQTGNNSQHFVGKHSPMRNKRTQHFSGTPFRIVQQIVPNQGVRISVKQNIQEGSILTTTSGKNITLRKELGKGLEGATYALDDSKSVCKIYFDDKLTQGRKQKLDLLLTRKVPDTQICYPQEAVYDSSGTFRGFTMPKAGGRKLGCHLFHPAFIMNQTQWNRIHSTQLALKILDKIRYLHRLNILVGDINSSNILIEDENTVYFVDCDSYQVEGFPCPAGTPAFTAPELIDRCPGNRYENALRTMEEELFAVAVLLFQIFIPGKHPYGHIGGESVADNIKRGHFPYALGERRSDKVPEGYYKYAWSHLSRPMKEAFNQCFHVEERGKSEYTINKEKNIVLKLHNGRFSIADWEKIIKIYKQKLQQHGYSANPVADGFDLAIAPQNRRRITKNGEIVPYPFRIDGRTDAQEDNEKWIAERIWLKQRLSTQTIRAATATMLPSQPIPSKPQHTPKAHAPSKPLPTYNPPSPPPPPTFWEKLWRYLFD